MMKVSATWLTMVATVLAVLTNVHAQNEIVPNPKAVKLRMIWKIEGSQVGGDEVGIGAGGLGDIFGTGYGAWAVQVSSAKHVRIYRGSAEPLDTQFVQALGGGYVNGHPVVGDLFGDDAPMFGIWSTERIVVNGSTQFRYYLNLHHIDSNRIADTPSVVWDSWQPGQPDVKLFPRDVLSADLNNDGAEELIIVSEVVLRNGQRRTNPEIWIYKGGSGFQVASPVAVIVDSLSTNDAGLSAAVGLLNDDEYPDLLLGSPYPSGASIAFYPGIADSPFINLQPQRRLRIASGAAMPDVFLKVLDCDGDGRIDLLGTVYTGDSMGIYLWRSGSGKDPLLRRFDRTDADRYYGGNYRAGGPRLGYLNDILHRYEMLPIFSGPLFGLSGGPNGPNGSYEVYYTPQDDGLFGGNVFRTGGPLFDVNGDGWDDYLTANFSYAVFGPNQGIALILAGGPYIPFDTAASSVQEVPTDEHRAALHLWPNPAHEEVNIAWRGDLRRMPHHFVVSDMLGRRIAEGEVNPWLGAALWRCTSVAAGAYVLAIYDGEGAVVATHVLLKQ